MVVTDGENSDVVDPLVGYSCFSLFPRSLTSNNNNNNNDKASSIALSRNPNSPTLNSLRSHLKSLAVRSADRLVNQAKTIFADSFDLLKADKPSTMDSEDSMESSLCVNEENPRARRPGLGLKRAKFSMKPMLSQNDSCMEPSIDMEKLEDPDEFFAAFDRMENAKKELRILKGEPLEKLDQNRASLAPRPRRPGLFGFRKPVTYKHLPYPSLSQEALGHDKLSPTREDVLPETNFVNSSPHARVSEVSSTMTSKTSELDELLSFNYEGLDEAGVQNFLQQKLNIKSIDIGSRPSFPDLPLPDISNPAIDSSSEALSVLPDRIFEASDTNNVSGDGPLKFSNLLRENSICNQQSSKFSQSPLSSISLLKRKISKLTSSKYPLSSLEFDSSPDVISYQTTMNGKQANQAHTREDQHGSLLPLVNGEDTSGFAISTLGSTGDIGGPRDSLDLTRSPGHEEENVADSAKDVDPTTGPMGQEDQIAGVLNSAQQKMFNTSSALEHSGINRGESGIGELINAGGNSDQVINEKMVWPYENDFKETEESIVPSEENVSEEILNRTAVKAKTKAKSHVPGLEETSKSMISSGETEESAVPSEENVSEEILNQKTAMDKAKSNTPVLEEPSKKKRKVGRPPGQSKASDNKLSSEEILNQKTAMAKAKSNTPVLEEPSKKKRKVGRPPGQSKASDNKRSKVNDKNRRSSLYGAGTHWEAGVRRSSRIRMRPLEYWKGERFLYGRVHESVVSVIGVKYASPTNDAKQPALKVKSFVSDEYKDIFEFASYH